MTNARRPLTYVVVVVFVLAVWEVLTITGAVKPLLLAAPIDVAGRLGVLFEKPLAVVGPVGVTVSETLIAFATATIVGVPLGVVVGSSPLLRRAYEPVLTTLNALPLVILYPVLAATLGIGGESKVALGALYAFFPIAISTARAAAHSDRRLMIAAETMGASRAQIIRDVVVPGIISPIITGMRVALALAVVTIIAAEFISGSAGVGYQLAAASQGLDTPTLFAWVVIACAFTIVVNVLFSIATNLVMKGMKR
jgi:NitT/TauT family transport system permease protein